MPDTQVAALFVLQQEGQVGKGADRQRLASSVPGDPPQNSAYSPCGAELLTLKDPFHGSGLPSFLGQEEQNPETQERAQGH